MDASMRRLTDNVFAWEQPDGSWWLNNAGIVVGGGSVGGGSVGGGSVGGGGVGGGGVGGGGVGGGDVGGRDVVLVDTCATAARTRRLLGAVARTAGVEAPIRFAINTH